MRQWNNVVRYKYQGNTYANPSVFNGNNFGLAWGVGLDESNGDVYVSDLWRCQVRVFDVNGNQLRQWGECGARDSEFFAPAGLAVTAQNVFIADPNKNCIMVRRGRF